MALFTLDTINSITCGDAVRLGGDYLREYGKTVTTPALDARWLLDGVFWLGKHHLKTPSVDCIPVDDAPNFDDRDFLSADAMALFVDFIHRRAGGEPVSHILGYKWFWDSCFYVNSHVLDPRPDSEIIIEQCLDILPHNSTGEFSGRILDLGTGSGCLMGTLLSVFPNASGVAVDICADALTVARVNMARLGVDNRVELLQSSWFDAVTGTFDLVVCNPPYIPYDDKSSMLVDVLDYDPHKALFANDDGLADYEKILFSLPQYLKPNSYALFEVGQGQAESVRDMGVKNGLKVVKIAPDYGGIDRLVVFLS